MSDAQFQRETMEQKLVTLPAKLLSDWATLASKHGKVPTYDAEWGCWELLELGDHHGSMREIVAQILESVDSCNVKVLAWNDKVALLKKLGREHSFVCGYLSRQPGYWRMIEKGDGVCCLYDKDTKPRSAREFLDFIIPRLHSIWPDGFDSSAVSRYIGYFACEHFRYASRLPSFDDVDINDARILGVLVKKATNR